MADTQSDLVDLLVQNLEVSDNKKKPSPSAPNMRNAQNHPVDNNSHHTTTQTPTNKTSKQNGSYVQQPTVAHQPHYLYGTPDSQVYADMQGRDREWAEYV